MCSMHLQLCSFMAEARACLPRRLHPERELTSPALQQIVQDDDDASFDSLEQAGQSFQLFGMRFVCMAGWFHIVPSTSMDIE